MCFGIDVAILAATITSLVTTIASTAVQSVFQAQQAEAQNEQNRRAQEAAAEAQSVKMKALADREIQLFEQQAAEAELRSRSTRKAVAQSELASAEAGITGVTAERLTAEMRRKRLEGVVAADRNMANLRQQTLVDAQGASAQFMAQDASLQWANEGAIAASAGLNIAGSAIGALDTLTQMDWGGGGGQADLIKTAAPGAPGSGVLSSEFITQPPGLSDLVTPLSFNAPNNYVTRR